MLIFSDVISLLCLFWAVLAMSRLLLQKGGLNFTHPLAGFLYKTTQWLVRPFRKISQPYRGWDMAIVLAVTGIFLVARLFITGWQFLQAQVALNWWLVLSLNFLLVLLAVFKAFIYALWLISAAAYLLDRRSGDRELRQVVKVITAEFCRYLGLRSEKRWVLLVAASLWLFIADPYFTVILQSKILFMLN